MINPFSRTNAGFIKQPSLLCIILLLDIILSIVNTEEEKRYGINHVSIYVDTNKKPSSSDVLLIHLLDKRIAVRYKLIAVQ